jgi:hypothetical protein
MGKFGDDYLRSASAAKVATFISGQSMNISGSATNATYATSAGSATNASAATNATFATQATNATTNAGNITATAPNYGSYGSIGVSGSTNGYVGISWSSQTHTWMSSSSGGVSFGVYKNNSSWAFYFDYNGVLQTGTIPGANVTGTVPAATNASAATNAGYSTNAGYAGYANSAGSAAFATNATYATSAGSATNAGYATSAGSATNATYATTAGSASPPSTFNSVGSYCFANNNNYYTAMTAGSTYSMSACAAYFDGSGGASIFSGVNALSGTWRWMSATTNYSGYYFGGIAIRIA